MARAPSSAGSPRVPTVEANPRRHDMAKMTAAQAAVLVMEKEGVTQAFGVPGAAINPLYAALRKQGSDRAHPGAPRRGRLAHGRGLHPRRGRQHRRVHRHLGPGRHRHDHRPLLGLGRLDPDPVHHRPGAARAALQGRLPGGRHRVDLQAGHQVVGHGARAGPGAARVPAGLPPDALGPPGPGADRPALRRADGARSSSTSTPTSRCRPTSRPPRARRSRRRIAMLQRGRAAADRRRRRHHQRRCERPAGATSPSSPACR